MDRGTRRDHLCKGRRRELQTTEAITSIPGEKILVITLLPRIQYPIPAPGKRTVLSA